MLNETIQEQKKNLFLEIFIAGSGENVLYKIEDIDDLAERQFIYNLGKRMHDIDSYVVAMTYCPEKLETLEKMGVHYRRVDRDELILLLEENEKMMEI